MTSSRLFNLSSVPVGLIRWSAPAPQLTVVIKATFDVHRDGVARLAAVQDPLCGDELGEGDSVEYASDFVPFKRNVDILLRGHAHSAEPAREIDIAVSVDRLQRSFTARAPIPSARIPLQPRFLVDAGRSGGTHAGPKQGWRFSSRQVLTPVASDADFNAAIDAQQLTELEERAPVRAWGLFPRDPVCAFHLPGLHGWACLSQGGAPARTLQTRLDTLWIDSDDRQVLLVWRSAAVEARATSVDIIAGLAPSGSTVEWADIAWQLGRTPACAPAEPAYGEAGDVGEPCEALEDGATVPGLDPRSRTSSLPFRAPERADTGTELLTDDAADRLRRAVLPFVAGAAPEVCSATPPVSSPDLARARREEVTLVHAEPRPVPPPPLVRAESYARDVQTHEADGLRPARPTDVPRPPSDREPTPGTAAGEDPTSYARVRVAVERSRNAADTLASFGLDERGWQRLQRAWTQRIAADVNVASEVRAALSRERASAP